MAGTGVGEKAERRKAVNANSTSRVSFVGITERAHLSRQDDAGTQINGRAAACLD